MLGNFTYANPTKLYFGENALERLPEELRKYGENVLLVYGGGSIKQNGIYDRVTSILIACGKKVTEDAGVMPNPTVEKLYEGCERARACKPDLILAVGGGSVCDYAKALSISVYCKEDPWEKYFVKFEGPEDEIIPVGCVLTMVGTGSEMNGGSVIHSSRVALRSPTDYEARSNLMWSATWALNTLVSRGKSTDWMVHMLGQAVGAYTDATHGMTLAAVSLPYYRYILPYGLPKFRRFAENVWGIRADGRTDEEVAELGLCAMEKWMDELGLVRNTADLGVTEEMLDGITEATLLMPGGYKVLSKTEIRTILKESMRK